MTRNRLLQRFAGADRNEVATRAGTATRARSRRSTNEQWDTITDQVMLLAAKNKIKEEGGE